MSASAARAAAAPVSAGRQPRARPTASTMVSASTASTKEAANEAPATETIVVRFGIARSLRSVMAPVSSFVGPATATNPRR